MHLKCDLKLEGYLPIFRKDRTNGDIQQVSDYHNLLGLITGEKLIENL